MLEVIDLMTCLRSSVGILYLLTICIIVSMVSRVIHATIGIRSYQFRSQHREPMKKEKPKLLKSDQKQSQNPIWNLPRTRNYRQLQWPCRQVGRMSQPSHDCRQIEPQLSTVLQYLSTDCQTCSLYPVYPYIRCRQH